MKVILRKTAATGFEVATLIPSAPEIPLTPTLSPKYFAEGLRRCRACLAKYSGERGQRSATSRGPRFLARSRRHGLTLFELLLALAIFLASLAALAQLLASGSRAAAQAKLQTEAILRCESKLGELVSGVEPLKSAAKGDFADDATWSWQATATPGPWPELQLVELQVSRRGPSSLSSCSYKLQRYVRDPRLFVERAVPVSSGSANRSGVTTLRQPAAGSQPISPGNSESKDADG